MPPPPESAGLPIAGENPSTAPGQGKVLRTLSELMRDISSVRANLQRREASVADLQRRFQSELQPLKIAMVDVRVDTFRVLGKHLRAGWLNKRARNVLEMALYDLANELEAEYGVDLREDRDRIFEDGETRPDGSGSESSEAGTDEEEEEDPGLYREEDFLYSHAGRGGRASSKPQDADASRRGKARQDPGGEARGGEDRGDPKTRPKPGNRDEAIAGDIRALYLMLARALHPDKEADPARLEEKTAWMQKVTAAYAERDLARLLDILARNPLDAVGPYLSQAPLKTVQGFAKRLRRELDVLRQKLAYTEASLDPVLAAFLKKGSVNETAYGILLSEVRRDLKFMKQRRDVYRTTQGLNALVAALRNQEWRELM